MNNFYIYDESIEFLHSTKKNVNNIPTITYYFARKTKTSLLPIEITFVNINDKLLGISPQLNEFSLKTLNDKMYYKNDIEFEVNAIQEELNNIDSVEVDNKIVEIYKNNFGVDISGIKGINGLTFEKILYIEDVPVSNINATSDGYIFIFTDLSSNKTKTGFYVGDVRPLKYSEYVERISRIGGSNILNNVIVDVKKKHTTIKNNTDLMVEVMPIATTYYIESKKLGEKIYTRQKTELDPIVLRPGQEIELLNDTKQVEKTYTLYSNPVKYIDTPFSNYSEEYIEQKDYIQRRPLEFKLTKAGMSIPEETFDDFFVISEFTDVTDIKNAKMYILNKNNTKHLEVESEFGKYSINSISDLYNLTQGGFLETFIKKNVVTALFKLNDNQYVLDYSFEETEQKVLQISKQTVYNDVISQHQEALMLEVGTFAAYDDFIRHNRKIKIDAVVKEEEVKYAALPYLMDNYKFASGTFMIDINDIADSPLRKTFSDYIFKSYDRELDSVIERFTKEEKRLVSNFKFINYDLTVSTTELAQMAPNSEIWNVHKSDESNDFTYKVKRHLADLGYEIALDEALKKLKRVAYIYTPEKDVINITKIGITLDNEWYFNGTDFYKAEEIENPKITTYVDEALKEYALDVDGDNRFIYSKKIFFGYSNDLGQEIDVAKLMLQAIATNKPIDPDVLYQNPAIFYMMQHTLDGSVNASPVYDDYTRYPAKFLFKPIITDNKNKFLWPNIFNYDFSGDFTSGGIFSKAKQEEMAKVLLNTATDVLESIQKIKIKTSTYNLIDYVKLKEFTMNYKASGYKILGIENFEYGFNDVVKFEYAYVEDKIINGFAYTSGMEYYINDKTIFGLYYNYITKKLHMYTDEYTVITDYSFILSLFDILLHYNIDLIEGYDFYALGEYRIMMEQDDGSLKQTDIVEPKYLYTPISNPIESDYDLYGVVVNYMDRTWYLEKDNVISERVDLGKAGNNSVGINIGVKIENDKIIMSKNGNSISLDLISLQNMPTEMISYNSFVLKSIRGKKFIPLHMNKYFLSMLAIRIDIEDHIETLVFDFGEKNSFEYNNKKYNLVLNGDGLQVWSTIGNHVTDVETILSLEDILVSNIDSTNYKEMTVKIVKLDGGKL